MAVSWIRWMVDQEAEEERVKLGELIRRKDREGYFRKGSGLDEENIGERVSRKCTCGTKGIVNGHYNDTDSHRPGST